MRVKQQAVKPEHDVSGSRLKTGLPCDVRDVHVTAVQKLFASGGCGVCQELRQLWSSASPSCAEWARNASG